MSVLILHLAECVLEYAVSNQYSEVLVYSFGFARQCNYHDALLACFNYSDHTSRQARHRSDLQRFRLHVLSDGICSLCNQLLDSFWSSVAWREPCPARGQDQFDAVLLGSSTDSFFDLVDIVRDNPIMMIDQSIEVGRVTYSDWMNLKDSFLFWMHSSIALPLKSPDSYSPLKARSDTVRQ